MLQITGRQLQWPMSHLHPPDKAHRLLGLARICEWACPGILSGRVLVLCAWCILARCSACVAFFFSGLLSVPW